MTSGGLMDLARRLLHLWVRVRLFPERPATLPLDRERPVCYVLNEGWLSDRLVLEEAARRAGLPSPAAPLRVAGRRLASAEFALLRGWPLFGGARTHYAVPPALERLIGTLGADAAADVQLVPVTVLWGRAPKQQDGILRALLAESWQRRHPLGHWLAVLLHGRHAHLHFGAPYSLRTLLAGAATPRLAARQCARVLRSYFRRQREIAIGPDVSHRHTQVEALLAAPAVRAAIAAEAERAGLTIVAARERARRHALAIASDYSYGIVRAGEIFLTWLWTRLFDGVEVRNFNLLTRIAAGHGIVYLPCHRSHLDYLLLSYVIFRGGLTPPHIAAGDNLDLPVVGRILRGGGAFFLRRSFRGDPLYASVFAEYLHRMLAQGFPLEFFIEGGRSRSGRLLAPKAGLLGMTVQSFLRRHERPLVLVPVYIGYEKLPEGASFVRELSGQPKPRESLWSLLSAVRVLRRHFGRVYVNFGTPLPLADWLDARRPDWRAGEGEGGDWQRAAVVAIAEEMARRINAAALVNPVNLVALALLATPLAEAEEAALARQVEHLQALLGPGAAARLAAPADGRVCIAAALRLGAVRRHAHPAGARIAAGGSEAAQLAYFRNNVLHVYALPALVASLVEQHGRLAEERLRALAAGWLGALRASLFLTLEEAELTAEVAAIVARLAARGLVERDGGLIAAPPADSPPGEALAWLAAILAAVLPA